MRSLFAALRSLVLPAGATTGTRIVLDGIAGRIQIYDANNDLLVQLDGTSGVQVFDENGDLRVQTAIGSAGFGAAVRHFSGDPEEAANGYGYIDSIGVGTTPNARGEMEMGSLDFGHGRLKLTMFTHEDVTDPDIVRFDSTDLNKVLPVYYDFTNNFPLLDPTGGIVVADDFWIGDDPGNGGVPPTKRQSLPRGTIDFVQSATDVTLSTTAGTYTTIVTGTANTLISGRRYKITLSGGDNMLSGGSGFATSDTWKQKVQVDPPTGGFVDLALSGPTMIARAALAAAFRYAIPVHVGYYVPTEDGSHTFRWVASKVAGAATVTSSMQTATVSPFTLHVEDCGE
jgi:hypothetical protein